MRVAIHLNSNVPKQRSLDSGQLKSDECSIHMAWQMIPRRPAPASVEFNLRHDDVSRSRVILSAKYKSSCHNPGPRKYEDHEA